MPQRFVPALGKSVAFPDSWTEQQIKDWVSQQSGGDGKTDIISSLKHGWKSGWADTADTYSDYKDALFRLLPGVDPKEDALDRASVRLSESAQQEGVPDTLTEKIASGLGAVPAGLLGLLPAIGGTVLGTAATGNPIAGAALGFGMHGAVREQDQDLQGILEGAAIGASEGAAFGALGKVLGPMKGLTGANRTSKALQHAAGAAGIGAGSNAVRQDMQTGEINTDDVIASGAVMGLLGLTPLARGKLAEEARTTGIPDGTSFSMVGKKNMSMPGAAERVIKAKRPDSVSSTDPHFLKYMDPENQSLAKQKLAGGMTDEQLIAELRANNQALPSAMLEMYNGKWAEAYVTGRARDVTKFTIEEANKVSREATSLRMKADAATKEGRPDAQDLVKLAEDAENAAILAYASGSALTSEMGRSLGALNAQRRGFTIGDEAIMDLSKKRQLTADAMVKIRELESAGKFDDIRKISGAIYNPKLSDKVHEIWKMGLLSNPLTWGVTGVNVISNTSYAGLRPFFKAAAIPFDAIVSKTLGTKRTTTGADVKALFAGSSAGITPALKSFIDAVKHERGPESGKLEMQHGPAVGGAVGKVVRFPGRMLSAADEFFRTLAESQETALIAREKLGRAPTIKEVSELSNSIKGSPLKHVSELNRIRRTGNEAVFTTSLAERKAEPGMYGALGTIGSAAQSFKSQPGIGRAAELIMPFVRTPTNIAIEALKMSPYGLFEGYRTFKKYEAAVARGASSAQLQNIQRQLAFDLGRAAIGTSIFKIIHSQAESGNITGGGPVDYDDYQKWIEAGNQPYSFKFGKDGPWVSYQRIEPFSSIFGAAADWHETQVEDENKLGRAWAAMKDNLANKTFLMGVENFARAWANPERYGESTYRNMASTFLPASSALGWAARAIDPVVRVQSADEEGLIPTAVANTRVGMSAKIPGLRETLEPRHSTTGRVIEDEYSLLNAISPMKIAPSRSPSIVETELDRLARAGFTMPTAEQRRRKVPGLLKTAVTTPEEYAKFAETNREASSVLERIMSTSSWSSLQDETKADIIDKVFKRYRRGSAAIVRESMRQRLSN